MNSHPHTVTVGETFNDVAVSITLEFTDAATGFGPLRTLGEELASRNNAIGRAVRESLRGQLSDVADKVNDAVWAAYLAEDRAATERRTQATEDIVQATKDETVKKYEEMLEAVKEKAADQLDEANAEHADTMNALHQHIDHLAAELQAARTTKRSNAAKAGHMRKASKAGRK